MNSVYNILDTLKTELRSIKGCNTVTFGDISDVDLDKTTIFPLAHIILGTAIPRGSVIEFNIKILAADIVDENNEAENFEDFYGNDNLQDVLNTQFEVLNRLVASIKRGDLFEANYQLVGDPQMNPFMDRFSNLLAGWETDIIIQIQNKTSIC